MHFGISSPLYASPHNAVTLALTGSWGSDKYMQTYYGVSAAQSAASGLPAMTLALGFMRTR